MKKKTILIVLVLILLAVTVYSAFRVLDVPTPSSEETRNPYISKALFVPKEVVMSDSGLNNAKFTIEEPIRFDNLQIFPIIGGYEIESKTYVTLGDALEQKLVKVDETSNVNELSITNVSKQYIFIHSGDIVKGGKQDRTIQYDLIVAPKAKKLPLASFCVERGRWSQRGNETTATFTGSYNSISSRDLKVSAKKYKNQSAVWSKVSDQQGKLAANISEIKDTNFYFANASETSLELTLEDTTLTNIREDYIEAFKSLNSRENLIGLAYAINGEVYGVDIFNNKVFEDLLDKMLDAFVNEAIADRDSVKMDLVASIEAVDSLIQKPTTSPDQRVVEHINDETTFEMQVYGKTNRFITYDVEENTWLHVNIIQESDEAIAEPDHRNQIIEDRY
jgi:hypothetical protein